MMNQTRLQILNIYSSKKYCRNTAAEKIPLKAKLKQRSPWEMINISASLHEAAKLKDQNPTPERIQNFKLIQSSFVKLYENEQMTTSRIK